MFFLISPAKSLHLALKMIFLFAIVKNFFRRIVRGIKKNVYLCREY